MKVQVRQSRAEKRLSLWLVILLFCLFALLSPGNLGLDSHQRYEVTRNIAAGHGPVTPEGIGEGVRVVDGEELSYARYPLGQSLAFLPLHAIVIQPLSSIVPEGLQKRAQELLLSLTWFPFFSALGAWTLFRLLRRFGYDIRQSLMLTLAIVLGTPYAVYSTEPLEVTQVSLMLIAGVLLGLKAIDRDRPGLIWLSVFLLTLPTYARPMNAVEATMFTGLACYWAWQTGKARLAWHAAGAYASFGLLSGSFFLADNYLRFGHPLRTGYHAILERDGFGAFSLPLGDGLWQPLIGWNWGLVWVCPLVLLLIGVRWRTLPERLRQTAAISGLAFVCLVLIFAKYTAYAGNNSYGPRMEIHLIPLLLLPLIAFANRRWFLAAAAVCAGLQLMGTALSWNLEDLQQPPAKPGESFLEMREIPPPGLLGRRPVNIWLKLTGKLDGQLREHLGRELTYEEAAALEWDFFWVRAAKSGRATALATKALAALLLISALIAAWRLARSLQIAVDTDPARSQD